MKLKRVAFSILVLTCLLLLTWHFGEREPANLAIDHENFFIEDDVDAYLAKSEQSFDDIIKGVEKQVIWSGEPGIKTPISIIYLHGFTATAQEIRPVPERIAANLNANIYFARLAGHGRPARMMADVSIKRWMFDVGEALKVGGLIGQKIIIMGTSTGGTLAAAAAVDKSMMKQVAGIIFISPNFAINKMAATLLTWPFARYWVPLVIGEWQHSVPRNDQYARYWTTDYPTIALMPMAALVKAVDELNFADTDIPALFYYSPKDQVVIPTKTELFAERWGGISKSIKVELLPSDDVFSHVIAGDIVSPGQTQNAIKHMLAWIRALQ
ncbi:lysophospholipase [Candidatus Puniceispirillum sp.]|nr:lysophospholipase [Candidatus Puniceispirillum sp.]